MCVNAFYKFAMYFKVVCAELLRLMCVHFRIRSCVQYMYGLVDITRLTERRTLLHIVLEVCNVIEYNE